MLHLIQVIARHTNWSPEQCLGRVVFSVMAAGWFSEKSGSIGKVEDVKLVL